MSNIAASMEEKQINQVKQPFILPSLPYDKYSLEPHITSSTIDFHYGKHHQTYVTNLNNLVQDSELAKKSLEELIKLSYNDSSKIGIFNNAAQVWNHSFYWHSMKKNGGGKAKGELLEKINNDFGSFEKFKEEFKSTGVSQFGSGWVWLVLDKDKLKIVKTPNADLPLIHNQTALITCDVWEHAYYLDFQNKRADYLDIFLNHLANWDFANDNYMNARAKNI